MLPGGKFCGNIVMSEGKIAWVGVFDGREFVEEASVEGANDGKVVITRYMVVKKLELVRRHEVVGVVDDDEGRGGAFDSVITTNIGAAVIVEENRFDARVAFGVFLDDSPRVVSAAIVQQPKLEIAKGLVKHTFDSLCKKLFTVIASRYYRDFGQAI